MSGGAAISVPVIEFFEDIGIPVCEGYGLTETCKKKSPLPLLVCLVSSQFFVGHYPLVLCWDLVSSPGNRLWPAGLAE